MEKVATMTMPDPIIDDMEAPGRRPFKQQFSIIIITIRICTPGEWIPSSSRREEAAASTLPTSPYLACSYG